MHETKLLTRWLVVTAVLTLVGCQDGLGPVVSPSEPDAARVPGPPQDVAAWFEGSADEVLALPMTVFADYDESADRLVFGVQEAAASFGVQTALAQLGMPSSAYSIEVVEPIYFANSLQDAHRPTVGGLQIHWSNYLCTLGFNADHSEGRSFVTNSHCTDQQGETGNTIYYQPLSSTNPTPIGTEADDPSFFSKKGCSRGKVCRRSDAARALYDAATESSRGVIAKTSGVNTGSTTTVAGSFMITAQDNDTDAFPFGMTLDKVGRTTGWTQGIVTNTCARVNVAGSNIQLLCQTLVSSGGPVIVSAGDSGSPVFQRTSTSVDDVTLVGLLWGGSAGGDLFVFSPLANIQAELGALIATVDGSGGGGGGGGGGEDPPDDDGGCTPRGKSGKCK